MCPLMQPSWLGGLCSEGSRKRPDAPRPCDSQVELGPFCPGANPRACTGAGTVCGDADAGLPPECGLASGGGAGAPRLPRRVLRVLASFRSRGTAADRRLRGELYMELTWGRSRNR